MCLEQAQTLVRIPPLQNLDIFLARPPGVHRAPRWHVEIDRIPPGQSPAIIFDAINLSGRNKAKDCAGGPARPIGRRAPDLRLRRHRDPFLLAAFRSNDLCRCGWLQRKTLQRRSRIRSAPVIGWIVPAHRNGARGVLRATNRTGGGFQSAAERVFISKRPVVGFRVRVGRRANILEIALGQGRLVFRQRRRSRTSRRRFARAQEERAKRGAKKKEKAPVRQSRWLLTVIHNHMQEYFSSARIG